MAKVYIKTSQENFGVSKSIADNLRSTLAETMFKATWNALQQKCQVDLNPKPIPASGLSLSGSVESLTVETKGQTATVKAKINMQLAMWPAPSAKSKDGEDMFGMLTGDAATVDGASQKQILDSAVFVVSEAAKALVRKRIDSGILVWQAKTKAKLDSCGDKTSANGSGVSH